jgi:hypothetical protein
VYSLLSGRGGIRKRQGDPSRRLGKLVFLGEELWWELLDLVGPYLPSSGVDVEEPGAEVCEDHQEESAEREEVAERYYGSLDLSERASEELEVPDWPDSWDEEKIWGDISPEKRRSLQRLLGSRAPKWMDT